MIALNVILCSAVIVFVVAPLAWAVRTAHRDHLTTAAATRRARVTRARVTPARRARARATWTAQGAQR